MTCEEARRWIPLIPYGETSFDEEEAVHAHVAVCAGCRAGYERELALHRALGERELEVSAFHLRRSRTELAKCLDEERANTFWWAGLLSSLRTTAWAPAVLKPVGALALVAVGFLGARSPLGTAIGVQTAGMADPSNARVRFVQSAPGGHVQLVIDETHRRVITGALTDTNIQALLVAAAKDPSDPGLRVESVDLLRQRVDSDAVRQVLVTLLQQDINAGVRLKALDVLKSYSTRPDVRQALSRVVLADDNAGLRTQAVDLLTAEQNREHVVGVLQELMLREGDGYIRLRCEKALRRMNASVDAY
jgi:hypothetical protein